MIKNIGSIQLADIAADAPENWQINNATHARVILPAKPSYEHGMWRWGYFLADRTLEAVISVASCKIDQAKMIRLPVKQEDNCKEEIFEIAVASFVNDRRFMITAEPNPQIEAEIIRKYVNNLSEPLVCRFHDKIIGFLGLKKADDDTLFVYLAAVLEKYRTTGAALALYASAILLAQKEGYKKLAGRISSLNMPVMNLYASLGARFAKPEDIFLKELI